MNNINNNNQIRKITEALLFVQNQPIQIKTIAKIIDTPIKNMEKIVDEIGESLNDHGIKIQSGPAGIQLITIPEANEVIKTAYKLESEKPLTKATLETLAIIAYKQPVTRAEIEKVRGVSCDSHLANLRRRGLVEVTGRAEKIGRPLLFSTTQNFLSYFGLENANQLPNFANLDE